jgi:hypothetical protein
MHEYSVEVEKLSLHTITGPQTSKFDLDDNDILQINANIIFLPILRYIKKCRFISE